MKKLWLALLIVLAGCSGDSQLKIASFTSEDTTNKVVVLLGEYNVPASIQDSKRDGFQVFINDKDVIKAREILTRYNFYFKDEDLNTLLESKFASLSKLETVKGNLLQSREIYNKLGSIPGVLKASVIVTGESSKRISVLIMSFNQLNDATKGNIENFLKGMIAESDTLTVSYISEHENDVRSQ